MKVGIFGGSFNPIHNTHVRIIEEILRRKLVDEVWVLPCRDHPFNKKFESAEHRVNMINLAIKEMDSKKVKICDVELNSNEKSYTYNTVRKLKEKYNHEFSLIIGSDLLKEIEKWNKYNELIKEVSFIIFLRESYPIKLNEDLKTLSIIKNDPDNTSSSEIRELLYNSEAINYFVPCKVEKYIKKNKLYVNNNNLK